MKLTQPMLFLGLGGTGCLVGTELERRLRDELCGPDGTALSSLDPSLRPFQLPPYVQFVYADLNEAETAKVRRRVVPTEEHLTASAATQQIANKLVPKLCNSYPEVALNLRTLAPEVTRAWLPPQSGEPRIAPLAKGAGQLPTVGRATLFETIRTGVEAAQTPIVRAISGLATSAGYLSVVGADAKSVDACDAFVCFSLAGGTGAGIFYDYLHLLGKLFKDSNIDVKIHPLVLMPSAFDEGEGGGRRAMLNAAPALVDLFRLVDDQNSPDASSLLGDARVAEAVRASHNVTTYRGQYAEHDELPHERISVRYPDFSVTLPPATVQTAFLFSRTVAIEREDLHRSIVSFVLSMVGTQLEVKDGDAPTPDQTYSTFAADFVNQGVERQAISSSGIGRRPVSTSLVASMTVPVDDLADIISARLLARAVAQLAAPIAAGHESNRAEIEAFFASCNLEPLRTRESERFQEPAPARGAQQIAQALFTRGSTMESRLPVLTNRLRGLVPRLAAEFDYLRGVRNGLSSLDPFRLARVVLGDSGLSDVADQAGFVGSLEARRQAPAAPRGMTATLPTVVPPKRKMLRQPEWSDPEVAEALNTQSTWYTWRTHCIWNSAWGEQAHVWDPKVARLRAEVGGLVGAFLAHARSEPNSFAQRTGDLYRSRTGVTYLLPPLGDLEVFYRSTVRRFLGHPDFGLKPTNVEADIVNALLPPEGWLRAYEQINVDSVSEQRFENAVLYVRNVIKQAVKGLFVNRGVYGIEQPLLPALRDLLAKSAGKEGPSVGETDLRAFQRGLAELLPAAYVPEGSGQLKILVTYPNTAKDALIEQYIQDKVNFPSAPRQTVQFRAVDTESLTVVLLRTSMGVSEVPELRRILTHWGNALNNELPQDFLAWRQRLGYDFRWLASTEGDRAAIMHCLLNAMWNGQIAFDGRVQSPDRVVISLPGDEPVSVVLALESYGPASSWADLVRAYERWVFSTDSRDEQIRPEFCQRLMQTVPDNFQRNAEPSELLVWFLEKLKPHQIRLLEEMERVAPVGGRAWIRQLQQFWTGTVEHAVKLKFSSTQARYAHNNIEAMLANFRTGVPAARYEDLEGPGERLEWPEPRRGRDGDPGEDGVPAVRR